MPPHLTKTLLSTSLFLIFLDLTLTASTPFCKDDEYLYPNHTCLPRCDPPYTPKLQNDLLYCDSSLTTSRQLASQDLCPISTMFYYPDNEVCKPTCPRPYYIKLKGNSTTCHLEDSYKTLVAVSDTLILSVSAGLLVTTMIVLGDPSGITVGLLGNALKHIKYMGVAFSPGFEAVAMNWESSFLAISFISEISDSLKGKFGDENVPYAFSRWGVEGSFLVNTWQVSLFLMITFSIWIGAQIAEWGAAKTEGKYISPFLLKKLGKIILNFWLVLLYSSLGDIIFFAIVEMRSLNVDSSLAGISFTLAIIFLLGGFGFLFLHMKLLLNQQKLRSENAHPEEKKSALEEFFQRCEDLKVLFKGFKDEHLSQQAFPLILVARDIFLSILMASLDKHPIVMSIFMIILNLLIFGYLVIRKPFKNMLDQAQQFYLEFLLFPANIGVFINAILDEMKVSSSGARSNIGTLILDISILSNIGIICLMIYKAFKAAKGNLKPENLKLKDEEAGAVNIPAGSGEYDIVNFGPSRGNSLNVHIPRRTYKDKKEATSPKPNFEDDEKANFANYITSASIGMSMGKNDFAKRGLARNRYPRHGNNPAIEVTPDLPSVELTAPSPQQITIQGKKPPGEYSFNNKNNYLDGLDMHNGPIHTGLNNSSLNDSNMRILDQSMQTDADRDKWAINRKLWEGAPLYVVYKDQKDKKVTNSSVMRK